MRAGRAGTVLRRGRTHPTSIHRKAVVEAFPTSFLGVMLDDPAGLNAVRRDRSDLFYKHLVREGLLVRLFAHLLPGRILAMPLEQISNHDDRAALVCGLTGLSVAGGQFTSVGDDEDGWIILPPVEFVRPWALQILERNAAAEPKAGFLVTQASRPPPAFR